MVTMPAQSPSFSKRELHRLALERQIERDHHDGASATTLTKKMVCQP